MQLCSSCGTTRHPPRPVCARCQSFAYDWVACSGGGTLFSWTVAHHAAHPAVAQDVPYNIALVQVDEGPLLASTVVEADELAIGQRVHVDFQDRGGFLIPVFVPDEASSGSGRPSS